METDDKAKDNNSILEKSETRFIIPFLYNQDDSDKESFPAYINGLKGKRYLWKEDTYPRLNKAKYLLSHVNRDLEHCHNYILSGEGSLYGRCHLTSGYSADSGQVYHFYLNRIQLRYFSTGIGLITITISYDKGISNADIADISAAISRFYDNDSEKSYTKKDGTNGIYKAKTVITDNDGNNIRLSEIINYVIGDSVTLFPGTENHRCFVFHRIVNQDNNSLVNLQENLWSETETEGTVERVVLGSNHSCLISTKTMCHLTDGSIDETDKKFRQGNINDSYYLMYIILIHEQQVMFTYYQRVMDFMEKDDNVKSHKKEDVDDIRADLLECMTDYSFHVISEEKFYQKLYSEYRDILNLTTLEDNIKNLVVAISEKTRNDNDNKINRFLTFISIISIVSIMGDAVGLVKSFTGNKFVLGLALVVCVMMIITASVKIFDPGIMKWLRKNKKFD